MNPKLDCHACPGWSRSVFSCVAPADRSCLAKAAVPHAYAAGQTIFHQGTPPLGVFCLRSGSVKLTRQFNHCDSSIVGVRGAGELIGYRAVLSGQPFGNSAETLEPSVVCTIPREDFLALLARSHDLAFHLLKRFAQEARSSEEQLVELRGEPVARRTARYLARLVESAGPGWKAGDCLGVPARREDMAVMIGTTPETLSRTLHALAQGGLLKVTRTEIRVRDLARLQKLAG
jgi:CRP/FNR family transcriptional regulator